MDKMRSFQEASGYVEEGAQSRFARFAVSQPPPGLPHAAALIVGSYRCITNGDAYVISMGLSIAQLEMLRDECEAALAAARKAAAPQ